MTFFFFHLAWPHPATFVAMPFATLISALVGVIVLYGIQVLLTRKNAPGPLPPGPSEKPILGNIADLPPPGKQDWMHWVQHKTKYGKHSSHRTEIESKINDRKQRLSNQLIFSGPISSITVMGQTIVIINDTKIALELLGKRSALYSSRPNLVFASEMSVLGN